MAPNKNSPVSYFLILAIAIICAMLFVKKPTQQNSPLLGNPLPEFSVPALNDPETQLNNQNLRGKVYLLNFWASWCSACQAEHEMLLEIKNKYHIPIFGIVYKDKAQNARHWLDISGNPYTLIGVDHRGDLAELFQIYGTPETFIVDKKGMIRYQFLGTIDEAAWKEVLLPLIHQYQTD